MRPANTYRNARRNQFRTIIRESNVSWRRWAEFNKALREGKFNAKP